MQSQWMLKSAEQESFLRVVTSTGPWPPGYPVLLFVAKVMGISPTWVNLLLFYLTLLLLSTVADKRLKINPTGLLSFYVLCGFNYFNLSQFTSEAMVIPMSILIFLTLLEYLERQTLSALFFLSVSCSVAFIFRYHAMLWLLPLVVGKIVFSNRKPIKKVCSHVGIFGIIGIGPIGVFMLRNYITTGSLTGVPRLNLEGRKNTPAWFAESTAFGDNVFLTLKTYFVDFLSPFRFAGHSINQLAYDISGLEIAALLLFALAIGVVILTLVRFRKDICSGSLMDELRLRYQRPDPVFVSAEFFVGYILITIVWWTIAIPDPIYTRFMYPSYVYFIMLMFAGYSFVEQRTLSIVPRLPFIALYLSVVFINLYKIAYHLP
jgi:hypothetical protein